MSSDRIRSPLRLAAVARTGLLDTPPEDEFDRLTELARRVLGVPFAFVTVVDDSRSYWKSCLGVSLSPGQAPQNTVEESFCQYVVSSGEALISSDVRTDPVTRDNPSIESMGVVAWAGFPVHTPDGEVLGTFCVVDTVVHDWSEDDVALLRTLAAVASDQVALRVALADAERQRRRAELLDRCGELLVTGLEVAEVLATVADLAVSSSGDHALVHTVHRGGTMRAALTRSRAAGRDNSVQELSRAISGGLRTTDAWGPGKVASSGRSSLVPHVPTVLADLPPGIRLVAEQLGIGSTASVPLRTRSGHVTAVLTVLRDAGSPRFSVEDVELLEAIAERAAPMLDNARRFGRERDFSLLLQEALLTEPPRPDDLHIAVKYLPAEHRAAVGGDWYDAFVQPGGATVLVIGDVTGHDSSAAVAMGQLRSVIRSIGFDSDARPAEVLRRSDVAAAGLGVGTTATAVVARLEPHDGHGERVLRWSNAGHPVPVVLDTDGSARLLETTPDLMLGVDPTVARGEHVTTLAGGQTLLLFTDGLVERRGLDYDTGLATLLDAVSGLHERPLAELTRTVLRRMQPVVAEDDVALIAVRANTGDARPALS